MTLQSFQLDLATVLLLHQCSFLVGALCFLYARWQSRRGEGLGTLAIGFMALAMSSTLAGLGDRSIISREIWTFGTFASGVIGYAIFWVGMRRLSSGGERRADWLVMIAPAVLIPTALVTQFYLVDPIRGAVSNFISFLSLAAAATTVLRDRRPENLPVRLVLSVVIALSSLLALMIVVAMLTPAIAPMTPRWAFFIRIICHFAIALFVIILVKERAEAALRRAADTDILTGVGNRRWFTSRVPKVMREDDALFLMDLDLFKQVNDRFGHDTGDQVLVSFADAIEKNLRADGSFARLGGEEFAAYLPHTSAEEAMAAAEQLVDVVRKLVVDSNGERVPLTVSIGVAMGESKEHSWSELLKMADVALYDAKNAGRDRAVLFSEPAKAAA
ncbi:GGDEF domain-containing protein [Rhizobium sp. S152]|uniref:GGDEF domain-containing protein n=1 Tax=Rhizobium sp. S152 TaxID=3055038 RepID=UPI0025A96D6F|nr:GGDEF domain-containing protein [Rhizobium sp. S152]MDM9628796.1 GGDEF domain-containing protein [Rhizobium sp. S152]